MTSAAASTATMMGMEGNEGMQMEDMEMGGMQMTFTTSWKNNPILFNSWVPQTIGQCVTAFIAIMFAAFALRALIALRSWVENHWSSNKRASAWTKPLVRGSLTAATAILSYGIMLVTMTYVVVSTTSEMGSRDLDVEF
jgi:hypothetical protein